MLRRFKLPAVPPARDRLAKTTEEDARSRRRRIPRRSSPLWTLVLESERPAAGSVQVDLGEVTELVVGRGDGRALTREGSHALLTVPDRWMSTAHVRVRVSGDAAEVEDAGSRNGTFVNGQAVERAVLADGDVVEMGHSFAVFRSPMPASGWFFPCSPWPGPTPSRRGHTA